MIKIQLKYLGNSREKLGFRMIPPSGFVSLIVDPDEWEQLPKTRIIKRRKFVKVLKTNYSRNKWIETFW